MLSRLYIFHECNIFHVTILPSMLPFLCTTFLTIRSLFFVRFFFFFFLKTITISSSDVSTVPISQFLVLKDEVRIHAKSRFSTFPLEQFHGYFLTTFSITYSSVTVSPFLPICVWGKEGRACIIF